MNREIKFRGKSANGWVYGFPFKTNHQHHTPDLWYIVSDLFDNKQYGSNSFINVNPKSIGLYTSLLDKNKS